jgi:hypothetical protein
VFFFYSELKEWKRIFISTDDLLLLLWKNEMAKTKMTPKDCIKPNWYLYAETEMSSVSAAQHHAEQHMNCWITLRFVLTRITRKFTGLYTALYGAAQQRIWIRRRWVYRGSRSPCDWWICWRKKNILDLAIKVRSFGRVIEVLISRKILAHCETFLLGIEAGMDNNYTLKVSTTKSWGRKAVLSQILINDPLQSNYSIPITILLLYK